MPNTTSTYEPLVLVDTADLPEEEWLEYRRRGIGGSDAAAILGVSPFATARDLYYDKLKVVSYEDGESNWVQKKVGHLLEDLVAEIFHVKTGFEIYQVKKMFYHPVYACMRACACAKHSSIEYGRHRYACAPARRELRRSSASAVSDPKTKMGTPFTLRRASRNRWSSSAERATSKMAKQKSLCTT